MYSSPRQVRTSLRRAVFLVLLSCLSSIVFIGTIFEYHIPWQNIYAPTSSAGRMLNRSQMLLAREVLLHPTSFSCSGKNYPVFIIVKTRATDAGDDFQRRIFIRTSWGREARSLDIPIVYAIERAQDGRTEKMLKKESEIYGDLLQLNYFDDYDDVSIKTFGILNWFVNGNCHHKSPYLFVVDDDVAVNIPLLMRKISRKKYGLHLQNIEPHSSGEWAVSLDDYPTKIDPDFITGASTLYPSLIITRIVHQFNRSIDGII